jgi:exodeoxyribonuclease VII large subunit
MLEQGTSLENARQTVFTAVRSLMDAERVRLNALSGQLPVCAALGVQSTRMYLQSVAQRLFPAAEMILKEQRYKLEIMKEKVEAASPEHILALGYSITRVNGRAVRSADDVVPGDEVTTFVAGGAFTSMVTEKNSR